METEDRIDRVRACAVTAENTIEIADDDEILWGADAIGEAISRNPRQANWLLTRGEIRCAQKRGKHWIAPRAALRKEFGLR